MCGISPQRNRICWLLVLFLPLFVYARFGFHNYKCYKYDGPTKDPDSFQTESTYEKPVVVVHIDLKGSPPKKDYLIQLFLELWRLQVTGVMIEYEDMFPYEGFIQNISARSAYTKDEIKEIVIFCEMKNIELIPMIQTFGKMEHVLKLEEFSELREVNEDLSSICPKAPRSMTIIEEMVDQVMKIHRRSKRIHIGCGEVFSIGKCDRCKADSHDKDESDIFFEHVRTVADLIRKKHKAKALIWDHMLRSKSEEYLINTNLTDRVEIVFLYVGSEYFDPRHLWHNYTRAFKKIWIAGAYRGADHKSPPSLHPSLKNRTENQNLWNNFIEYNVNRDSDIFAGYMLTGDSKSDHFARSVELLPVSVPSLFQNLHIINSRTASQNSQERFSAVYDNIFGCPSDTGPLPHELYERPFDTMDCSFPEAKLVAFMVQLDNLRHSIQDLHKRMYETNNWLSPYHLQNDFFNPDYVTRCLHDNTYYYDPRTQFTDAKDHLMEEMRKYFTSNVIEEWSTQHIEMYLDKIELMNRFSNTENSKHDCVRRN